MAEELNGRVSVLIPARNEESNVALAVRSVAAQQGVREVIVVDDQSSDRTGEILDGLKKEIPQLRTLRVESLPQGWMGKANALATAAREASGEWLLFTDADTEHLPGGLEALLARAESEGIDLLSLSPGQKTPSWWEKAVIPLIYARLASRYPFEEVSDPKSATAAANGQYILIRRKTYDAAGGHEAVRAEMLEDVELARRVKSGGGRILFLPGAAWAETRMYRTFREMWAGWTKNLFALYGAKVGNILGAIADVLVVDLLPPVALIVFMVFLLMGYSEEEVIPTSDAVGAGMCALLAVYGLWSYRRTLDKLALDRRAAKYLYAGAPMFIVLLVNSTIAHLRGRVHWKGRDYSTRELKKGAG